MTDNLHFPKLRWNPRWLAAATGLANAVGVAAVVTFFILTDSGDSLDGQGVFNIVCSVLLVAGGISLGTLWGRRSAGFELLRPEERSSHPNLVRIQAHILNTPYIAAAVSLIMWGLAGPLIAVIGPLIHGHFSLARAAVDIIGISIVGGLVTTVVVFFGSELLWRRNVPFYLMGGEIGSIPGALRAPVKARLLVAVLFASLIPLMIMAVTGYLGVENISRAPAGQAPDIMAEVTLTVALLLIGGTVLAVLTAIMLAKAVAGPLRDLAEAMDRVAHGELDVRVEPITNDELGALTDGFNRMVAGLAERETIRDAFGRYVDSEVATQILEEGVNIEGEMKDVTVLFADLRGFTTYAESHHPSQVLGKLNGYFSAMSRAIGSNGGVILQYVGDEIYAVFGAPRPDPLHADKAYLAALQMRDALAELNAAWRQEDGDEFAHGIGLHSGLALAGNVGSRTRMTYNLVGDTVNTASRVAGLTKRFDWDIIVSQDTVRRFSTPRELTPLEAVEVKGRQKRISVYKG